MSASSSPEAEVANDLLLHVNKLQCRPLVRCDSSVRQRRSLLR
jgi:hypothetical protein